MAHHQSGTMAMVLLRQQVLFTRPGEPAWTPGPEVPATEFLEILQTLSCTYLRKHGKTHCLDEEGLQGRSGPPILAILPPCVANSVCSVGSRNPRVRTCVHAWQCAQMAPGSGRTVPRGALRFVHAERALTDAWLLLGLCCRDPNPAAPRPPGPQTGTRS